MIAKDPIMKFKIAMLMLVRQINAPKNWEFQSQRVTIPEFSFLMKVSIIEVSESEDFKI